jgi:Sec-independent protein secretion pathway component TatC
MAAPNFVKKHEQGATRPLSPVLLFQRGASFSFLLPMTFRFINCSNHQRIDVEAADHDQALRTAATIAGHFFISFIKAF